MNWTRQEVRRKSRAFTLVELLVVVSIIALLVSILLPSLKKAREQAKSVVCLSNLKALSTGVLTYASEYGGTLPGPLHPAVYRHQTLQNYYDRGYSPDSAKHQRNRQLTWVLHTAMSQRGESKDNNVADTVGTCPTLAGALDDTHFDQFEQRHSRYVWPTHYVLNHYGDEQAENAPPSMTDTPRATVPQYYFGFSPWLGAPDDIKALAKANPPRALARIKRSSDEWMLADAWYRGRTSPGLPFAQNEGPYQAKFSGVALAYYAPHFKRGGTRVPVELTEREAMAKQVREKKTDGRTNTTYFDGHGEAVASKTLSIKAPAGTFENLLYGFPGTVNWKLSPLFSGSTVTMKWD